jgi:hypothetical protein
MVTPTKILPTGIWKYIYVQTSPNG